METKSRRIPLLGQGIEQDFFGMTVGGGTAGGGKKRGRVQFKKMPFKSANALPS